MALLFFSYLITDQKKKGLFHTSPHSSLGLTNRQAVIKGILSYVSEQSMKGQLQKQLAELELPDKAEELER